MYYTASAKNPRRTHFRRLTSLQQCGETNTMYNNVFVETVNTQFLYKLVNCVYSDIDVQFAV